MAAPSDISDQLSDSSKKAFYWADVMSTLRYEQGDESSPGPVNVYDLFVGILLSHPRDSEAKALLDHFKLQPGQVLPQDYTLPDEVSVRRLAPTVSTEGLPSMDDVVNEIVEIALNPYGYLWI